jgi:hypothetical protein
MLCGTDIFMQNISHVQSEYMASFIYHFDDYRRFGFLGVLKDKKGSLWSLDYINKSFSSY